MAYTDPMIRSVLYRIFPFLISTLLPSMAFAHDGHVHPTPSSFLLEIFLILAIIFLIIAFLKPVRLNLLFIASIILLGVQPVFAADVTVTSPSASSCLKGGTSQSVTWTQSGNDHFAIYYRTDGGTPNWSSDQAGLLSHPVNGSSYGWTVPQVTTSSTKIWVEGHPGAHTQSSIHNASFSIDNSAPDTPTLSSTSKTSSSVTLSWNASDVGCKGISSYKLYRNGSEIATPTGTTYTDSDLGASTSYTYKVKAVDGFSFESSFTTELSVTTDAASSDNTGTGTTSPSPSSSSTKSSSTASPTLSTKKSPSPSTSAKAIPSPTPTIVNSVVPTLEKVTIGDSLAVADPAAKPQITIGEKIRLAGIAPANTIVIIYLYSKEKSYEVPVDSTGQWSATIDTSGLTDGEHKIAFAHKDVSGNVGEKKDIMQFSATAAEASSESLAAKATMNRPNAKLLYLIVLLAALIASLGAYVIYHHKKKRITHSPLTYQSNKTNQSNQ